MKTFTSSVLLGLVALSSVAIAETTAITGAKIYSMGVAGTLENGTVVMTDGRITAVGSDVVVPDGATVVDASGKILTPGLITPMGQLGLVQVSAVEGSVDAIQRGDMFTASFDVAAAYNPRSLNVIVNRTEGITRALIGPVASSPDELGNASQVFSGLGSLVQLGDEPEFVTNRGAVMVVRLLSYGSISAAFRTSRQTSLWSLRLLKPLVRLPLCGPTKISTTRQFFP